MKADKYFIHSFHDENLKIDSWDFCVEILLQSTG
jgi:hypothetical protein